MWSARAPLALVFTIIVVIFMNMSMVDDTTLFGFDQRARLKLKRAKHGDTVIGLARQTRRDHDRSVSPEIDLQTDNSDSEMDSDRNSSDSDGESDLEIDSDRSECELEGETYEWKRYFSETTKHPRTSAHTTKSTKRPRTSAHTTPTRNVSSSIEESF